MREIPGFDYPPGYTAFQFVFVLLQSAAFGGVFTGFGIARDFETRLRTAAAARGAQPHRDRARLRAAALSAGLRPPSSPVVALAVGMNVSGSGVDLFGLYALAADPQRRGPALGLRRRDAAADDAGRAGDADPRLPRPLLRAGVRAASLLQGWIHGVAVVNPVTRVLEAGRGFVAGWPTEVAAAFGAGLALAAAFSLWALRGLRKAEAAG